MTNDGKNQDIELEKTRYELERYKKIASDCEIELEKVMKDYKRVNNETEDVRKKIEDVKKDMENIEASYNFINAEYISLETEFLKIIELAQTNPENCIVTLREYANRLFLEQEVKKEEPKHNRNFKVIEGGKKD